MWKLQTARRVLKTPLPGDGEWGWKNAWFSEAGLLAATEDQGETGGLTLQFLTGIRLYLEP